MLTSNPYDPADGERRGGTVGFPLPGVGVRVARRRRRDAARRARSAASRCAGPNVFKGYWRMPEKTREEFTADGWFKTGDVGKIDARGYVTHRRPQQGPDHQRRLQRLPGGDRGVHQRDARRGRERAWSACRTRISARRRRRRGRPSRAQRIDARALIVAALKAKIANFKVPKRCFVVDELPRNAMGKVQKNAAARAAQGLFAVPSW